MTIDCVMHIGAGKCGSSSLQARLSENPYLEASDGKIYEYICLKGNGRVLRAARCQKAAAKSAYGYSASVSVRRFFKPDSRQLKERIRRVATDGRIPILSFEGWLSEAPLFHEWQVLKNLGLEAKIIIFVRPQIDWINSSWWQWGAWSKESFAKWLQRWTRNGCWAKAATQWRNMPGVKQVNVFTTTTDVITTFFRYLNVPSLRIDDKSNTSLDGAVLRFLQEHKELGAGKRQSAMHAVLCKHLQRGSARAPWILKKELIEDLIEYYKEDNAQLLTLVDQKTRLELEADPHWWAASAYEGKRAERPGRLPPQAAQIEDVAARAILAVLNLDEKLRSK